MIWMFQQDVPCVFPPRTFGRNIGKSRNSFPPPHIGDARPLANTLLPVWLAIPHFRLHDRTRPLHFMGFRCAIASQTNGLGVGPAATAAELNMTCRTDQAILTDVRPLPPPTHFRSPHNQTFSKRLLTMLGMVLRTVRNWCGFSPWQNCSPRATSSRHTLIYYPQYVCLQMKRRK